MRNPCLVVDNFCYAGVGKLNYPCKDGIWHSVARGFTDSYYLFRRELGLSIIFAKRFAQPSFPSVFDVCRARNPLKVLRSVVCFDAVNVVDVKTLLIPVDPGEGNKPVNIEPGPVFESKCRDTEVSVLAKRGGQEPIFIRSRAEVAPTVYGGFISKAFRQHAPILSDLKVGHTGNISPFVHLYHLVFTMVVIVYEYCSKYKLTRLTTRAPNSMRRSFYP